MNSNVMWGFCVLFLSYFYDPPFQKRLVLVYEFINLNLEVKMLVISSVGEMFDKMPQQAFYIF